MIVSSNARKLSQKSESMNGVGVVGRRYTRKMKDEEPEGGGESREGEARAHGFIKALMAGPGCEKERAKLDFVQATHRPRVYKAWVREMADIVRDYFW